MYCANSTIFGSIRIRRSFSGEQRYKKLMMMLFVHTDLPEPVVPAISRCGIFARLPTWHFPAMSLPRAKVSGALLVANSGDSSRLRSVTMVRVLFGISMPTAALPGMGASMRTPAVARFSAISSARPVMRLIFTPACG